MAERLTVEQVREMVKSVGVRSGDPEAAHGDEDDLHQLVLQHIADGTCDDPAGCAAEALKTLQFDFPRRCA